MYMVVIKTHCVGYKRHKGDGRHKGDVDRAPSRAYQRILARTHKFRGAESMSAGDRVRAGFK